MNEKSPSRGVTESEALEAALACFARTGFQRTSMEDIARELRRSRPVAYRYFSDKTDAFRKVTQHLLDGATTAAREALAATAAGQPTNQAAASQPDSTRGQTADRVFGVLDAKLSLAIELHQLSPHHASALLAEDSGLVADLAQAYMATLSDLLISVLGEHHTRARAAELAEILLALTRGLEADLRDPAHARALLRTAVALLAP